MLKAHSDSEQEHAEVQEQKPENEDVSEEADSPAYVTIFKSLPWNVYFVYLIRLNWSKKQN